MSKSNQQCTFDYSGRILINGQQNTEIPSQRLEEVHKSPVPSVGVIQVARMPRPFYHHHSVIGQLAQVAQGQFSKLGVLVAINYQRWSLNCVVLLCGELVGAYRGDGDVGPDRSLVLRDEGQGVHAAEGGADHHHRVQAQLLTHLLQEPPGGQLSHRRRGLR